MFQAILTRLSHPNKVALQPLAVKLAHHASEMDDAYAEDPLRETMEASECSRTKSEVAWLNIIASRGKRCEWRIGLVPNE